jgi:hypothetical protein
MEPLLWQYSDSLQVNEYITPYTVERTPNHVILEGNKERRFYGTLSWCPNCERSAKASVTHDSEELNADDPVTSRYYLDTKYECETCGWWSSESSESTGSDSVESWVEWKTITYAVLKALGASAKDLPLQVLERALTNRPNLLYSIHDRKFEEFVASVLNDFYPGCEVALCGRSGDQGIDLVVVVCDAPIAVQVRRRMSPDNVETVYPVREFLGAALLRGFRELIYVTTSHFTRGAIAAADAAVARELVSRYQLIDADRLRGMFNLARRR